MSVISRCELLSNDSTRKIKRIIDIMYQCFACDLVFGDNLPSLFLQFLDLFLPCLPIKAGTGVYVELCHLDVLHFVIEECRHLANDCTAQFDVISLSIICVGATICDINTVGFVSVS